MRVAVCFACNEAYIPLCKGLLFSILDARRMFPRDWDISLNFVDIGCSAASLDFLRGHGVVAHSFSRASHLPGVSPGQAPAYADAQLCRPFLPEVVPDHDVYVWIDCDIWVQGHDAIPTAAGAARAFPGKIVICPEYHYGYMAQRNLRYAVIAHRHWYVSLYGEDVAEELCFRPLFNSGFFALERKSVLWEQWGEELRRLYAGDADGATLHFAEQIGLNRLIQREQAFVPLDPLFNYACGGSAVFRNPQGRVVVGYPPFTPVKCAHLLDFPRYGAMYLQKGLLYKGGKYLDDAERASLLARAGG